MTVNTSEKSSIDLDDSTKVKTLTLEGAGALKADLSALSAATAIDGSGATGNLTLGALNAAAKTVSTGAGDDSFTLAATVKSAVATAAGDDTVTLSSALAAGSTVDLGEGDDVLLKSGSGSVAASTSTATTVIDGGAGTDTIAANLVNAGNGGQFANFETLGLTSSTTLDAGLLTGSTITSLELLSAGTSTSASTFSGVDTSQSLNVRTTGISGTTTLSLSNVTGASDTYAIKFDGDNSSAASAPTAVNYQAGTVVTAGVENYSIESAGTQAWNGITLGANSDAETVTITGSSNLTLAFASGFGSTSGNATGVSSIDGSAATGDLAINLANVVQNSTLLAVTVGAGDDTVTTAAKIVTVTLGDGEDEVIAIDNGITVSSQGNATAQEAVSKLVTITDFSQSDSIDFSGLTSLTVSTNEIDVSAATTLLQALTIAANGGASSGEAADYFEFGGDTYVLFDETSSASGGLATGDIVTKLSGSVDLTGFELSSDGVFAYPA